MYQLTVNETQLKIINSALEEYFRIGLNQWDDLANRLAAIGVDFSSENPNHDKIFDSYINKRDDVHEVLKTVGRILWPYGLTKQTEENLIAQDIWQVIRHQLWIDSPKREELSYTVDAREPLQMGGEPMPGIRRLEPGTTGKEGRK